MLCLQYPHQYTFSRFALVVFVVIIGAICSGCSSTANLFKNLPEYTQSERVTQTHIPYPILLLHGLGQKAAVWDSYAVKYYEQELGLVFGGTLRKVAFLPIIDRPTVNPATARYADFFTVSFSNPTDSIGAWELELEQYIRLVLERTRAEKVVLIGYSMGGVTSRYYLTKNLANHRVARLITVGSPHQGSAYAKVWNLKNSVVQALNNNPNFVMKPLLEQTLNVLKSVESDVPMDAPAVRDLRRPEDGGEFMQRIANAPHPLDVEYVSVVGKVEVLKEAENLSSTAVKDLVRRVLSAGGLGFNALFEPGDGVVSASSQTMNELPWFKNDKNRQRISRTITLTSVHEDHLRQSTEIQRISLEDKPEFKGAEFYRNADATQPRLVIEFVDYLPPAKCSVELTITDAQNAKQRVSIPRENIVLVRKKNGSVVAEATFVPPPTLNWNQPLEFSILTRNSFGNQFTANKNWLGK